MKKTMWRNAMIGAVLIAAIVSGIFVITNKQKQLKELNQQYSELNSRYEERDALVNEFTATMDEIENSLTFVKNKRSQLSIEQKEGNPSRNQAIVADIKLMNEMLEESSKKIESLEKRLHAAGVDIKSFKEKIARLTKNIEEQNASIESLKNEIMERDRQIALMGEKIGNLENDLALKENTLKTKEDSLKRKSEIIVNKDNELNKAYFASGTYRELKENGVVDKTGGFLFLGRNEKIREDFNAAYFTELDKRSTDVFPIFSKKAKMISQHPDSSYRYIYEGDQIAYLKIEKPDEFWKMTKYAVVEVK